MKRSAALAPLSRDHHVALVEAMMLSRADEQSAGAAAERFVNFLAGHEVAHFALEESILLPALPAGNDSLAARVLADHEYLRDACARLGDEPEPPAPEVLHEIGARLRAHVRLEERELFPLLERELAPDELERIGSELARRDST